MLDGTKLNVLSGARQLLRAFGGLNETYGCSEAELSESMNFSSRGYPALQTRRLREKVREQKDVQGAYYLDGLLLCIGGTLEYTGRDGVQTVLPDALSRSRKQMVGMGRRVLIWPDKKMFDTEARTLTEMENSWSQNEAQMRLMPCDTAGKTYTANHCSTEEPSEKTDGMVWLQQDAALPWGQKSVVKIYHERTESWEQVLLNCCRMECSGVGEGFRAGDAVTVTGMPGTVLYALGQTLEGEVQLVSAEKDALVMTIAANEDSPMYYGTLTVTKDRTVWSSMDGGTRQEFDRQANSVEIERRVPELDFVTVQDNRVWGCSTAENSIYASKLGDATNWYSYQGTAADSYAVGVGSEGAFTGAASCMGYVLFFKENILHKLYGTKPSDFRVSSVRCRGVATNAGRSLCVLNEALYYLSNDGVMLWDGSLPVKISAALDEEKLQSVDWTAAGCVGQRYYLYLRHPGSEEDRLLVYDTERGIWHRESGRALEMVSGGRRLYLWDGENLWAQTAGDGADAEEPEEELEFYAVSGDIGMSVPDDKYVSRITLRVDAQTPSVLTVAASYDGGAFEDVASCVAMEQYSRLNMPFVPRRCDTLRIRLSGTGQIALRSMALTLADSSGNRVQGARPQK